MCQRVAMCHVVEEGEKMLMYGVRTYNNGFMDFDLLLKGCFDMETESKYISDTIKTNKDEFNGYIYIGDNFKKFPLHVADFVKTNGINVVIKDDGLIYEQNKRRTRRINNKGR